MKTLSITISIPDEMHGLEGYEDGYIALLWNAAQANPKSSFEDPEVARIVELLSFEIIRRFLKKQEPTIYHHQAAHFFREETRKLKETYEGIIADQNERFLNKQTHVINVHNSSEGDLQAEVVANAIRGMSSSKLGGPSNA